jgi:hypothetical protein
VELRLVGISLNDAFHQLVKILIFEAHFDTFLKE